MHILKLIICSLLFLNVAQSQDLVQDYLKSIGQEPKKAVTEGRKKPADEKSTTLKDLVGKMVDDLDKKQKLNGENLAQAVKDHLNSAPAKDLKPEQVKKREADIEKICNEIKNIDKSGSVTAEKYKAAAISILNPNAMCANEKEACETNGCCEGLKCISIHEQNTSPTAVPANKCVKPIKLGKSCLPFQTVCETGLCKPYYTNSTNLAICLPYDKACKKDEDCCSKICDDNKCNHSYRCQDCIDSGKKIKPGEKCCEGYYESLDGRCVTDYPPASASLNSPVKKKSFFFKLIDLVIPSAEAQTPPATPDENADFTTCTFNSKRNYIKQLSKMIAEANPPTPANLLDTIDAIRAFEFMSQGPGVNDYWKDPSGKSIYTRAKAAGALIKQNRLTTEAQFKQMDQFMLCTCIDVKGKDHPSVTEAQRDFYNSTCANTPQTSINAILGQNGITAPAVTLGATNGPGVMALDDLGVGASGIKYQEMLVRYFARRVEIQSQLFTANGAPYQGLVDIRDFLYGVDWDYFEKTPYTWDPGSIYKTVLEEAVDFLTNLIKSYYNTRFGNPEQKVNQISPTSVWNSVKSAWNQGLAPAGCSETYRDWDCSWVDGSCVIYYGSTHHYSCTKEIYVANPVCGKEMPNSFCLKVAMKRTAQGKSYENRWILDPLIPETSNLPTDLSIISMMNWNYGIFPSFNPPSFDESKYGDLKALASKYAKDNDFYQTQADQDAFGEYVYQKHFLAPYLANSGVAKHPTPGIIPYYEDMVQKMDFMSDSVEIMVNPPAGSGDGDLALFIKFANNYVKLVDGLGGGNLIKPGSVTQQKVNEVKAALSMANFQLSAMGSNSIGMNVKDFASFKNGYFSSSTFSDFNNARGAKAIAKAKRKKIYDNWMKQVGNTPRGKSLLQAKNLSGIYGAPQGIADSNSSNIKSHSSSDDGSKKTATTNTANTNFSAKGKAESDDIMEEDYGSRRNSNQNNNDANSKEKIKEALAEIKSENYQPINQDTLFQIVSKAYARGAFPNLLYGQPGIPLTKSPDKKPELVIDDEKVFAPTKSVKRKAPSTPNN